MVSRGGLGLGLLILVIGLSSLFWASRVQNKQIAVGGQIYAQHCATCHGPDGEGQANWKIPNADGTYPAPPHTPDGHTWHHADQVLLQIIAEGGASATSGMPGFAEELSHDEIEAVLAYLKTFWGKEERRIQRQMTEQYDQTK